MLKNRTWQANAVALDAAYGQLVEALRLSTDTSTAPVGPQPTAVATSVNLRDLRRVGARPPFLDYLVSLWDYRHFIYYDAQARVQTGNEQDRLGRAWLVLGPLLNGLMFYLIMGVLLKSGGGIENFVAFPNHRRFSFPDVDPLHFDVLPDHLGQ